jgi:hypothetical protein
MFCIVPSCLNKRGRAISQNMSTLAAGTKQRIDADGFVRNSDGER